MKRLRWMICGMLACIGCAIAVGLVVMYSGVYNVAASEGHTRAVYWVLEQGMRASVRRHSAGLAPPMEFDESALRLGARCFDVNCVQCHGGPGKAPGDIGKGMLPIAGSLVQTGRDWPVEQIYWVTRHGIRMAGMPAWEFRLGDRELWAVAGFVREELPRLDVASYQHWVHSAGADNCGRPAQMMPPDIARGLLTIRQYGCHGCHEIPGITGPAVQVGPPLRGFARRPLIAGSIPNTPENLLQWLRDPQSLRPHTLMPDLAVTEQHARDMRAYLASLQ